MTDKRGAKNKFPVDNDFIQKVKTLSGQGLTQEQIYNCLGMSHTAWFARIKKYPELKQTVEEGKAKGIAFVTSKLMELIKAGDRACIMFYLKTQAGWKETSDLNIKSDNKNTNKNLNLDIDDPIELSKIYSQYMTGKD